MSRRAWARARLVGGAAILAVLVWRLGTGPFVDGLHRVGVWSLLVASCVGVVTTAAAAWRWSVVARGLGVAVELPTAVASYYRSQFLNTALPGGVVGDVHRGVSHGREVGDVGRGLRAVAWERCAGQTVQVLLALIVLVVLPSPVRTSMPVVATVLTVGVLAVAMLLRAVPRDPESRAARTLRAARGDVRDGLFAGDAWMRVMGASVVVVIGHVLVFLIAARTAGSTASVAQLLPLAMLVMVAMAVPANIGGWGPREGVAAAVFAAAGLGAAQGVATATVYGVMVIVASLPGAVVLLVTWLRRGSTYAPVPVVRTSARPPVGVGAHG